MASDLWKKNNQEKMREYRRKHYANNPQPYKDRAARRRKTHPSSNWESNLRAKFGINAEEYETLLKKQNGLCAICSQTNGKSRLCVDHDHATGKVRGLLCTRCNRAIGIMQDNLEVLRGATVYLQRFLGELVSG